MKSTICFLAIVCLIGGCLADSKPLASNTGTQKKPPKTRLNPLEVAKLLPAACLTCLMLKPEPPGKDRDTCQGLWFKEGYVCNKDRVMTWSQFDRNMLLSANSEFGKNLENMKQLAENLLDQGGNGLNLKPEELALLRYYTESNLDTQKEEGKKCISSLIQVRNSALCSICSGKNYRYFTQDKKGLLDFDSCMAFINTCDAHFTDVARLFEAELLAIKIDKLLNPHKTIFEHALEKGFTVFVQILTKVAGMLTKRIHLRKEQQSQEMKDKASVDICQHLISIVHPPLLTVTLRLMNANLVLLRGMVVAAKAAAKFKEGIKQNVQNVQNAVKKILTPGNWRKLELMNTKFEDLPAFDKADIVVMRPTDNMFTSFEGAQGTGTYRDNECKKALNISLRFP